MRGTVDDTILREIEDARQKVEFLSLMEMKDALDRSDFQAASWRGLFRLCDPQAHGARGHAAKDLRYAGSGYDANLRICQSAPLCLQLQKVLWPDADGLQAGAGTEET